jgi:hypothetical protein
MCNCKNTTGFQQKITEANQKNISTGLIYVVFVIKNTSQGDLVFMAKESDLNDELGICCYFLANGKEVDYVKKNINQIPVNNAQILSSKTAKKKHAKTV